MSARGAAHPHLSHYLVGSEGPEVVVPGRVAAWLERRLDLRRLRTSVRGADPEIDAVLLALSLTSSAWLARQEPERFRAGGTEHANRSEPDVDMDVSTSAAAAVLGVTSRAVTKAIAAGQLPATKAQGRWRIDRNDLAVYRAARRRTT